MRNWVLLLLLFLLVPVAALAQDVSDFKRELALAQQGDAGSQNDIGIMLAEGRGVKRDDREAVFWFKKSAEQGHVLGSCNLALHYARGQGVRKNPVLALKWSIISHSLDGLKCFPDDFVDAVKPSRAQIKKSAKLALAWLRSHPNLKNEFGESPWLEKKPQPNKGMNRTRNKRAS